MLKILENSNRNYTFSALLTLLLDAPQHQEVPSETAAGQNALQSQLALRWADLVVKCLIKSTKALPQIINVGAEWVTALSCCARGSCCFFRPGLARQMDCCGAS